MQKSQLDHWLHGKHKDDYVEPKIYVISSEDVPQYLLAVEYKHKLEPVQEGNVPIHFSSLEKVKEELLRLGVGSAYLRLHNTDDEYETYEGRVPYHDIELSIH